ncbi:hypothetical protein DENSPDRAFT_656868 [Dentipellis sp. KUC8613]|nr:hypothetical protein DENSPDRAFT_656868 [Dentipellis sp. KUC8613]
MHNPPHTYDLGSDRALSCPLFSSIGICFRMGSGSNLLENRDSRVERRTRSSRCDGLRLHPTFAAALKASCLPWPIITHPLTWPFGMADTFNDSLVPLAFDLGALKLYYVAVSALWIYDYFLTLGDEVTYAYAGKKGLIFGLYLVNRYFAAIVLILTLLSYFLDAWTTSMYPVRSHGSL